MAEGFLKGIWGKPATEGTGIVGLWGTVKKAPSSVFKTITTPIGVMKAVVALILTLLMYTLLIKGKKGRRR